MQSRKFVIAIPFAGGNKYSYSPIFSKSSIFGSFVTLELPGRGRRMDEPLLNNIELMLEDLYTQIQPYLTNDYLIFGHSMGGILGNLLIHKLNKNGCRLPSHFIIAGCTSPNFIDKKERLFDLPTPIFKERLFEFGGMPVELMEDTDLMELFFPIIRADMYALHHYKYVDNGKYPVDITVIFGTNEHMNLRELQLWEQETSGEIQIKQYPGDHFFIFTNIDKLCNLLKKLLFVDTH